MSRARAHGRPGSEIDLLLSLFDFEAEARKHVSHEGWERIQGASADEITLRWNREVYDQIRLKPRA